MNRIRMGLSLTILLGTMYAAIGLLDSLAQFALGVIIAATATIAYGFCDFLEDHRIEQTRRGRDAVWARRDAEAARHDQ